MARLARIIALVATAMVVGSFGLMLLTARRSPDANRELSLGFETPSVALDLLEEPKEVAAILGAEDSSTRAALRRAVDVDFGVIAAYWLLFVLLAVLLAQRWLPGARLIACVVFACVTAAAVMDVVENVRLYALLRAPADVPTLRALIEPVRRAAVWKWSGLFAATMLVSPVFYGFDDEVLYGFGLLFVVTGLVGLAGLRWYPPAVEWAFGLLVVALLVMAGIFLFDAEYLIEEEQLT